MDIYGMGWDGSSLIYSDLNRGDSLLLTPCHSTAISQANKGVEG